MNLSRYLLIFSLALLFAFLNSGWLLGEGYWGIDEGIFHKSILKAREAGATGGFLAEIAAAYDPGLRNYGPNYVMYGWACTWLFGTDAPWAWRLPHLVYQALFIFFLYLAARQLGAGRFGACFSVIFAMVFNSSNILPDMQSYGANWYRPFASDTHAAVPIAGMFWAFSAAIHQRRPRLQAALLSLGVVFFTITIFTKASYIFLAGVPIVALALAAYAGILRDRRVWITLSVLILILGTSVAYFIGPMLVGGKSFNYEVKPTFKPQELSVNAQFYLKLIVDTGYWPVPFLFFAGLLYLGRVFVGIRKLAVATRCRIIIVLCTAAAAIGAFMLQCTWPMKLPRYAIVFVPQLSLFIGVIIGWQWKYFRKHARTIPQLSIAVPTMISAIAGIFVLYIPTISGPAKTLWALASVVVPISAALLWSLARTGNKKRWSPLGITWGGVLFGTLLSMCPLALSKFSEVRSCFQVDFRGMNQKHEFLARVAPTGSPLNVYEVDPLTEFFWSGIHHLNRLLDRPDIRHKATAPFTAGFERPAVITWTQYPHPGGGNWLPKVVPQGGLRQVAGTGSVAGGIAPVPDESQRIRIPIPTSAEVRNLGMVTLRVYVNSIPFSQDLVVRIVDTQGKNLGEATYEGELAPYPGGSVIPLVFTPMVRVPPNVASTLEYFIRPNPRYAKSVLRRFELPTSRPMALLMKDPDNLAKSPVPGISLYAVDPWVPGGPTSFAVLSGKEAQRFPSIETPGAIMYSMLVSKSWGYNPSTVRWRRHCVTHSMLILP